MDLDIPALIFSYQLGEKLLILYFIPLKVLIVIYLLSILFTFQYLF